MTYFAIFMLGCGTGIFASLVAIELGRRKGRAEVQREYVHREGGKHG